LFRIMHVDHATVVGGAERSILELAAAQVDRGYEVTVAVGGDGAFLHAARGRGVDAVSLELPRAFVDAPARPGVSGGVIAGWSLVIASRRILAAVDAVSPDIVQVHTRKSQLATLPTARHARPVLFHLRDPLPRHAILRAPMVLAVRRAAHAVALTPWVRDQYRRAGALPRSGVIGVVPSGVKQERLAQLTTPWLDGRAGPRIGFVGQIASWKGPHLIVELAELIGRRQEATFHLVGDVLFPAAEMRYGEWLRQRIASSPARDLITWHPATSSPEAAMDRIDILVHTSIAPEPFGRVLVEAMAGHRPIVAFRRGSTESLLTDETAAIARADGIGELGASVESLLRDREAARDMAMRAADAARAFEPSRVADLMDAEYERVMR
jgi:glycosyltransferase involved in cell wall biosynthesis